MKCSYDNCPGRATWQPVLGFQTSVKSPVVDARLSKLAFCEMHKDMARLTDYISPATWERISRFMAEQGKPVPKRNLTSLRFVIISSPESTAEDQLPF